MTKRKSKRSFVRKSTSKPSSTRKHVICDCNICQGAEVDPRTKESHMKKREISRVFTDRTPERPSEIGTSQSHITNDPIIPMEMDEMEISYDSEDEQYDSRDKQKFNFLAKKIKFLFISGIILFIFGIIADFHFVHFHRNDRIIGNMTLTCTYFGRPFGSPIGKNS